MDEREYQSTFNLTEDYVDSWDTSRDLFYISISNLQGGNSTRYFRRGLSGGACNAHAREKPWGSKMIINQIIN